MNLQKTSPQSTGFLKWFEIMGNKIPDTFSLFLWAILGLIVLSAVMAAANVSVVSPTTQKAVAVKSLLSVEALHWILTDMLKNFAGFPPLALILVITMGIGVVQKTELLQAIIRSFVLVIPKWSVTVALVFIAFFSHMATDVSFLIMPPIGALVFYSVGRHPLAGLAAAMAGVGGGYSANLIIVGMDVILAGLSTSAAQIVDKNLVVSPVDNWFFMVCSVMLLTAITTIITDKIVEPRLGKYTGNVTKSMETVSDMEKKALRYTCFVATLFIIIVAAMVVPDGAILRNPQTGGVIGSPFLKGIAPLLFVFFVVTGLTYGVMTGMIKTVKDLNKIITDTIKSLSGFIVLIFFIAQFSAAFNWSNLGEVIATAGADFLMNIGLTGVSSLLLFIILCGALSCFIPSGSAMWALLAPLFVPMFMMLGYHPAFTQLAMRIGLCMLIPIVPTNPFLPVILKAGQEYVPELDYGKYLSLMIPYIIAFNIAWPLLYLVFHFTGLPIGPGVTSVLK